MHLFLFSFIQLTLSFSLCVAIDNLDPWKNQELKSARGVVPGLIEKETPVLRFLRAANFNPTLAAEYLAMFWKHRKILFGERWILPMTQTGKGALLDIDIQLVRSGVAFCVSRDDMGPIILTDFSKAMGVFTKATRLGLDPMQVFDRCSMYWAVVWGQELAKGHTTLFYPVTSNQRPSMEFRTALWDMLRNSFPMKIAQTVIAQAFEDGKMELLDLVRHQVASMVEFNSSIPPLQIRGNSIQETIELLEKHAFPRHIMPLELGGDVDYDAKVAEWVTSQVIAETEPGTATSTKGKKLLANPVGTRVQYDTLLKRSPGQQTEEEYLRQRNRLYVQRHVQKRNLMVLSLEDQRRELQSQNQSLTQQNQCLEEALKAAQDLVATYSG